MMAARVALLAFCIGFPTIIALSWIGEAKSELAAIESSDRAESEPEVAVAAAADDDYCTRPLKRILHRVLKSCGLLGDAEASAVRGCQPVDAKRVATMSGSDFNALFTPMKERGGIIQFDQGSAELDDTDRALVDKIFADQAGASYFFVVSRASPEGSVERNRELSKERAEVLMEHLRQRFDDPDLEREVGLLWLGEEFAQLETDFCSWRRSDDAGDCTAAEINRSAFVAWIDCRL